MKLRTSSSHEEGCERTFAIATKEFIAADDKKGKDDKKPGRVAGLRTVQVQWQGGKMIR